MKRRKEWAIDQSDLWRHEQSSEPSPRMHTARDIGANKPSRATEIPDGRGAPSTLRAIVMPPPSGQEFSGIQCQIWRRYEMKFEPMFNVLVWLDRARNETASEQTARIFF
jgi:hypothetical protein